MGEHCASYARRNFLRLAVAGTAGFWACAAIAMNDIRATAPAHQAAPGTKPYASSKPNILLITADDLHWQAVGAFGCPVPRVTPNIDKLASEGIRFDYAHVNIAICQPSRSAIMTGRYPHRSGGEGFFRLRKQDVPVLPELLLGAGYRVGILGKVGHSTPSRLFDWDMAHDMDELGHGRDPEKYREFAAEFMRNAADAAKPFFLMANSHDPHRPFYGHDKEDWYQEGETPPAAKPSRVFSPEEIVVPRFLPDLPGVRQEISEYFSSVRRCDDSVGAILAALDDTGQRNNTLVVFLSDNGMPLPFAKTNCYLHSTKTPLIIRWPGVVKEGTVDKEHFVSGIDLMPTFLESLPCDPPQDMDGFPFLPLLTGAKQAGREHVFTQFHLTVKKVDYPMRCVQTKRFGYIYNPWANGTREFKNESQGGRSWKAMVEAVPDSPEIAERVKLFSYRTTEELYDFADDPNALNNLAADPAYAQTLDEMRHLLENWMIETEDLALEAFRQKDNPEAVEAFLKKSAKKIRIGIRDGSTEE